MTHKVLANKDGNQQISQHVSGDNPTIGPVGFSGGLMGGFPGARRDMTDRDLSVLHSLNDHLVLTAVQIMALNNFPSLDRAQRRLLNLYRRGFIDRTHLHSYGPGRAEFIYFLSRQGLHYVCLHTKKKVLAKPPRIKNELFLSHMVLMNDFWICLKLALQSNPVSLVGFIPEFSHGHSRGVKATSVDVTDPTSGEKKKLIPDAVFSLGGPKAKRLYFLEIDRATGKIWSRQYKSFIGQVQKYMRYRQSKGFESYNDCFKHKFPGFHVLYVTQSENRIRSYQRALADFNWRPRFILFSSFKQVTPSSILGKIWYSNSEEDEDLYSIIR